MNHVETDENTLLEVNRLLLQAIVAGDWETYEKLCDPTLSAFEPEALGHLVEGMPFHRFYFELGGGKKSHVTTTMVSPKVRLMGEAALITYIRLTQKLDANGSPITAEMEETRLWHKQNGQWKHVHFHRSNNRRSG